MLTGIAAADALQRAFHAGANFFLQKPVSVAQLRHLLNATRGAMLEERRNYQRAPVSLGVEVHWSVRQERATLVNLSASGALLTMVEAPPEGTEVTLEFALPHNAERMSFTGQVTRASEGPAPGEASGRGVGVEFTSVQPRHRRLVANFVEKTLSSLVSSSF
jgi:c-di-GMP-binding flagellar brake protein YcgR